MEKVLPLRQETETRRKLGETRKSIPEKSEKAPDANALPPTPTPEPVQNQEADSFLTGNQPVNAPLQIGQPALPGLVPGAPEPLSPLPKFALAGVEKPGGSILVLGVQVNDQGKVVDAVIVVPSNAPLTDLGLLFAYKQQTFTELHPPYLRGKSPGLIEAISTLRHQRRLSA